MGGFLKKIHAFLQSSELDQVNRTIGQLLEPLERTARQTQRAATGIGALNDTLERVAEELREPQWGVIQGLADVEAAVATSNDKLDRVEHRLIELLGRWNYGVPIRMPDAILGELGDQQVEATWKMHHAIVGLPAHITSEVTRLIDAQRDGWALESTLQTVVGRLGTPGDQNTVIGLLAKLTEFDWTKIPGLLDNILTIFDILKNWFSGEEVQPVEVVGIADEVKNALLEVVAEFWTNNTDWSDGDSRKKVKASHKKMQSHWIATLKKALEDDPGAVQKGIEAALNDLPDTVKTAIADALGSDPGAIKDGVGQALDGLPNTISEAIRSALDTDPGGIEAGVKAALADFDSGVFRELIDAAGRLEKAIGDAANASNGVMQTLIRAIQSLRRVSDAAAGSVRSLGRTIGLLGRMIQVLAELIVAASEAANAAIAALITTLLDLGDVALVVSDAIAVLNAQLEGLGDLFSNLIFNLLDGLFGGWLSWAMDWWSTLSDWNPFNWDWEWPDFGWPDFEWPDFGWPDLNPFDNGFDPFPGNGFDPFGGGLLGMSGPQTNSFQTQVTFQMPEGTSETQLRFLSDAFPQLFRGEMEQLMRRTAGDFDEGLT